MDMIKIAIVEDHAILRETLCLALRMETNFEVVGNWNNAEDALRQIGDLNVDIVVSDNKLPGMDGIVFTKKLKERYPQMKIIVLSMITNEESILEALEAGAMGYLPKEVSISDLIQTIKNVHKGALSLSPELNESLLRYVAKFRKKSDRDNILSPEHIKMLSLAADGCTNKEIADRMDLPLTTVKLRFQEIFNLLDARHRTHAILKATKLGILSIED
jgi:DNA-binding NarL/FixJ family response regulator